MSLGIRRAGLQAHHVRMVELQFRGVLDGDQALVAIDEQAQDVEQGGLARAGAAADQDVAAPADGLPEELQDRLVDRLRGQQVGALQQVATKLADRQAGAVEGDGRDDRVDPAAVGQARVHHRARLVQAPPERGEDALDEPLHVRLVDEAEVATVQHPVALDEDPVRTVDQDLGDRRIAQQRFQRAEADQLVDQFLGQPFDLVARHRQVQAPHILDHAVGDVLRDHGTRAVHGIQAIVVDGVDQVAVQRQLQRLRVAPGAAGERQHTAQQVFPVHAPRLHRRRQPRAAPSSFSSASRWPSARRRWLSRSRGASSNSVRPRFLAFSRNWGSNGSTSSTGSSNELPRVSPSGATPPR
ncbi:hypothetical protein D3C76_997180 [compost metagenome]